MFNFSVNQIWLVFTSILLGILIGFTALPILIYTGIEHLILNHDGVLNAIATLFTGIVALIIATVTLHKQDKDRDKERMAVLQFLAGESLEIYDRARSLREDLELSSPKFKYQNLYMPKGFENTEILASLKPEKAVLVGRLRRLIKGYKDKGYDKDREKFKKERNNVIKRLNKFIGTWDSAFGSAEDVRKYIDP